jgi:glutamate racemase
MKTPIGIFDSGYGGLSVLKEIVKKLPQYDYCYFGDNARAPYGERTPDQVYAHTKEAVSFLFAQGSPLVILACNTASAIALRRLQQEWLLDHFPGRRVLGVLIPVAEAIAREARPGDRIGLLATPATVASGAYRKELEKILPVGCTLVEQACPLLVPLIEGGYHDHDATRAVLATYLAPFQQTPVRHLILGCTHYPLLASLIRSLLGNDTLLFSSGEHVAFALQSYLIRHPEVERTLSRDATKEYYTTGNPAEFRKQAETFLRGLRGSTS